MPIAHRLLPLVCLGLLSACSPTTPLFIAQIGTQEVVEYKTLKTNRMTAAIEEDGDLLRIRLDVERVAERSRVVEIAPRIEVDHLAGRLLLRLLAFTRHRRIVVMTGHWARLQQRLA